MAASLVGQKLGKYDVTKLIGHGGMATVYKAHQSDIERNVAIKVLPPHPGQDDQFVERFRLEARTIARLQHPHILPLYDYGDENGVLYLVMAYIDGGSVSDRVRRGLVPPREVETILKQVAGALDYAHRQGIIHRDIKPDNILLDREGHALLADFGIVKLIEGGAGGQSLTITGGLVGTPAYMSPEQAQGLAVDNRSDLYSLGVVVFEMLTGKQPYPADTPMQVVFKHVSAPIPPICEVNPALPGDVDTVMRRILAKSPTDRYPTAQAFAEDFGLAIRGELSKTPSANTFIFPQGSVPTQPTPSTPPPVETGSYPGIPTPPPGVYVPGQTPQPGSYAPGQTPPPGTYPPGQTPPPGVYPQYPTYPPPQPTIITQQGTNPLVLLGGFAIIAVLIVVVVLIVVSQNNRAPDDDRTSPQNIGVPTGQAAQPTQPPVVLLPTPAEPNFGRTNFSTTTTLGDTVNVQLTDVRVPPQGQVYTAWLQNTSTQQVLSLGEITLDALGNGALTYRAEDESVLPALYNSVLIGLDDPSAAPPEIAIAYSGRVPVEVTQALRDILVDPSAGASAAPAGEQDYASTAEPAYDGSLLDGALTEAEIAARHSGLAAGATSVGSMRAHAEHTINTLNGTREDYDGNGRGENPGRGFGVMFFVEAMWERLDAAVNAPDSNALIQSQAELIRICVANASQWKDQVVTLETAILTADSVAAAQPNLVESTMLAQALVSGIDLNENGQVEPFEGECGLEQILDYGVSVGNMHIFAAQPEG